MHSVRTPKFRNYIFESSREFLAMVSTVFEICLLINRINSPWSIRTNCNCYTIFILLINIGGAKLSELVTYMGCNTFKKIPSKLRNGMP